MMIQAGVLLLVLLLISVEMWQDLLAVQNGRFLTPSQQQILTWQIAAQYLGLFLFLTFLVLTTTMPLAAWLRWLMVGAVGLTAVYLAHNLLTHQLYLYRRRPPRRQMGRKRPLEPLPRRQILQGVAAVRSGRWYLVALVVMLIFMLYQEYRFFTGI